MGAEAVGTVAVWDVGCLGRGGGIVQADPGGGALFEGAGEGDETNDGSVRVGTGWIMSRVEGDDILVVGT